MFVVRLVGAALALSLLMMGPTASADDGDAGPAGDSDASTTGTPAPPLPTPLQGGPSAPAPAADASNPPPARRSHSHYSDTFFARLNPVGLSNEARLSYRIPVGPATSPGTQETYLAPLFGFQVSPAYLRPIIGLEFQPFAFLNLYAGYEPAMYFNSTGSLHSYASPNADAQSGFFSTSPPTANATYAAVVHQFTVVATLQAQVGGVFARSSTRLHLEMAQLHGGDAVYYDPAFDLLAPKNGWVLENDTDVGWALDRRLRVGLRYATLLTWYPESAYPAGEALTNPNSPIMRTGPIAAYTLGKGEAGPFDSATFFVLANWFVEHRYRTGDVVSAAAPYLGIGVTVAGDS
jgi:hypothetical protein